MGVAARDTDVATGINPDVVAAELGAAVAGVGGLTLTDGVAGAQVGNRVAEQAQACPFVTVHARLVFGGVFEPRTQVG